MVAKTNHAIVGPLNVIAFPVAPLCRAEFKATQLHKVDFNP